MNKKISRESFWGVILFFFFRLATALTAVGQLLTNK